MGEHPKTHDARGPDLQHTSSQCATRILLVRHGRAGKKADWRASDELRPLDRYGRDQAQWLVGPLTAMSPGRILSSPYLRCRQSVEPLAEKLGLLLELSHELVPESGGRCCELINRLSRASSSEVCVVCTHGETLGFVLGRLVAEGGVRLVRSPPGAKACIWTLSFVHGELASVGYQAPPQWTREGRRDDAAVATKHCRGSRTANRLTDSV